jgi:nucleotide-binding universal stress UspA family protein
VEAAVEADRVGGEDAVRGLGVGPDVLVGWDAVETREREILAERLAGWQEKYPDVTVRRMVAGGKPATLLLKETGDAQLLVVGSRGRDGFAGMLLGSTSQALIHHAPCPLLVIRPAAAA